MSIHFLQLTPNHFSLLCKVSTDKKTLFSPMFYHLSLQFIHLCIFDMLLYPLNTLLQYTIKLFCFDSFIGHIDSSIICIYFDISRWSYIYSYERNLILKIPQPLPVEEYQHFPHLAQNHLSLLCKLPNDKMLLYNVFNWYFIGTNICVHMTCYCVLRVPC